MTPRKNIKRVENLITMCCLNAVAHVFFYKQTAQLFQAGQTTTEYPKGKPFEIGMLYECAAAATDARDDSSGLVHGLEHSIGTSSMGLNTMTIVAEVANREGDHLRKVPQHGMTSTDRTRTSSSTCRQTTKPKPRRTRRSRRRRRRRAPCQHGHEQDGAAWVPAHFPKSTTR